MREAKPHSEALNAIERLGTDFLRKRASDARAATARWSSDALARIRSIERATVIQAGVAGAVTGAIFGATELLLAAGFDVDPQAGGWVTDWRYWALYLGIALVVSGIEIAFLYWRILCAVARVGSLAGLDLKGRDAEQMMSLGLSRAALDIPNPRAPIHGIDPYARIPRWRLLASAVAYRLKIGATSIVVRVLLRRLLARAAIRSLIPFAAIGVYAVWNALVSAWVLAEARHRAAGPVAIDELDAMIGSQAQAMTPGQRHLLAAAVAESVMRSRDAHPNYVLFVDRILDRLRIDPDQLNQDWSVWNDHVAALPGEVREALLRVVTTTCILNGRPRRQQRDLLESLARQVGRRLDAEALARARKRLATGQGVDAADLDAVTPLT